jgi:predicted MFS family arabinose efflux permease
VAYLENKPNTFKYIIIGVLFLPISFVILLLGQNLLFWALVYTLTMTLSEIFAMPFMMNYALSRPLKERQGQYAALYSIAYGIANIAAPSLGLGIASKYGFENMFYFLIAFSCFNFLGFWCLKKSHG